MSGNMNTRTSFRSALDLSLNKEAKQRSLSSRSNSISHQTRANALDKEYLGLYRKRSKHGDRLVCKNGPGCVNHDWNRRSPMVKVCTRDEKCPNHDWTHVDRKDSPYRLRSTNIDSKNYDFKGRSPMRGQLKPMKKVKKEEKNVSPSPQKPTKPDSEPSIQPSTIEDARSEAKTPQPAVGNHDKCLLQQSEKHLGQQMAAMCIM